jgi:hypothetical protein
MQENIEVVDSSNKDEVAAADSAVTPTSKSLGRRSADSVESLDDFVVLTFDLFLLHIMYIKAHLYVALNCANKVEDLRIICKIKVFRHFSS